jgi:hypothetical protein
MTAQNLIDKLHALRLEGHDLSQLEVTFRRGYGDIFSVSDVEEGYYDVDTNEVLETIVLTSTI